MASISFAFRIGFATAQRIIVETCEALWLALSPHYMPVTHYTLYSIWSITLNFNPSLPFFKNVFPVLYRVRIWKCGKIFPGNTLKNGSTQTAWVQLMGNMLWSNLHQILELYIIITKQVKLYTLHIF